MKRNMPLSLIVLAMLANSLLVANRAVAAPSAAPLAVATADTLRFTDTIYVHVPVNVFDTAHDTLYNPPVHDTLYGYPECHGLQIDVDSVTPWGKVSGNGAFPDSTEVEIAAIADWGYRFLQWDDGNTENPRTIVMDGAMHFTASFVALPSEGKAFQDGPRPDNSDTVIFRDTVVVYVYDTTFVGGRDTVYITPHDTLFIDTAEYFEMLVLSGDEERGLVAGNGLFPDGCTVEIAALPAPGVRFVQWHDNNRENPRRVLMDDVQIFVGDFVPDTATHDNPPDVDPDPEPWNAVLRYAVSGLTVTVTSPASAHIRIFTPDGRIVARSEPVGDRLTESVRSFALPQPGVYLVQVGAFPVKKFVLM